MDALRIIFMGSPEFALPSLKEISDTGHDIVAVYTQPPKPKDRGKKNKKTKVGTFAESQGFKVCNPISLKSEVVIKELKAANPDIIIVVAYGKILTHEILSIPKFGCINAHASILPRWRGAAPIQRAIMEGDTRTGVSIIKMEEGLDSGPIYSIREVPINESITCGELHDKLSILSATMIVETIDKISKTSIQPKIQSSMGITHAKKIKKYETQINWRKTASQISCQVRGLNPYPGAWFDCNGERIKVLKVKISNSLPSDKVGKIRLNSKGELLVTCGSDTVISLKCLQYSGKKPLNIDEFLRGRKFPLDTILSCPDIN
ncbi:MAG: methionyl-tRNA formyltransferase [Rhodospirillaceae bacterium]|nr:methionyl-tRNA formyltransferase [Rhodospirillaceae bacterium]